ncbi:unnamed protein product, partial [Oikopleura dioica]
LAFATSVPLDIHAFHCYTKNSSYLSNPQSMAVSDAVPGLSPGISRLTYHAAYAPFTPSDSEQRSGPSYYRGCWHEVSRPFLFRYYQPCELLTPRSYSRMTGFTIRRPSSSTRRCTIRVAPIVNYSRLLPPVGVWTVSQFQCNAQARTNSRERGAEFVSGIAEESFLARDEMIEAGGHGVDRTTQFAKFIVATLGNGNLETPGGDLVCGGL